MNNNNNPLSNQFPNVFPEKIWSFISDSAKALGCTIDFIASSILVAVSIAIGSKSKIRIKKDWEEAVILFLIIVGEPGSKKTPAIKIVLNPIFKIQASFLKAYESELSPDNTKADFQKNILTTDATIEALALLMYQNSHGLILFRDEAIGWIKSMNQYKAGGDDMEKYLSLFSQTPIIINRKTGPQIQVDNPFLSFIGGIQVDVVQSLSEMTDNGFVDRLLFCFPDAVQSEHTDFEISEEQKQMYENIIIGIYEAQNLSESKAIALSQDAQELWKDWHTDFCRKIADPTAPYYLRNVLSKLEAYTVKFALILEYVRCATINSDVIEVSKDSVQGAILLTDYFTNNFMKVRGAFASSALDKKIQAVVSWLRNNNNTAKTRQIYTNRVAGIKTANEALDIFMEMKAKGIGAVFPTNDGNQKGHSFMLNQKFQKTNY